MTFLCISNQGEIEDAALTLLGASTKRNDETQIGFFGSGLNYSIAWLLRNNREFHIFSGTRKIQISVEDVVFRNQSFSAILIEGRRTGLTTDAGPKWTPWEILREIYCNALDEGDAQMTKAESPSPSPNRTSIFIKIRPDTQEVLDNFDHYFTTRRTPLWSEGAVRIYPAIAQSGALYRRGIRVKPKLDGRMPPIPFDIDHPEVDINESREATQSISNDEAVWDSIFRCDNPTFVRQVVPFLPEGHPPYSTLSSISTPWREFFASHIIYNFLEAQFLKSYEKPSAVCVSGQLLHCLERAEIPHGRPDRLLNSHPYDLLQATEIERRRISAACRFLARADINIPPESVHVADLFSEDILGRYCKESGRILISRHGLSRGMSDIAMTILEEHVHKLSGSADETREMQDALLRLVISTIELLEPTNA